MPQPQVKRSSRRGVFCLDVKTWKGKVSVQEHSWHLNFTEETEHFSNTSISQVADPIQVIKTKTENLWNHLMRSGVCVHQSLFLSRVVFLNPDCHVDPELQKSKEVVAHCDLDSFISSFKEGYLAWISDAVTPYLLSGHLSYNQLNDLSSMLQRTGTWDTVSLHGGQQLKGDYRGCQHIALNREETVGVHPPEEHVSWVSLDFLGMFTSGMHFLQGSMFNPFLKSKGWVA
ncbi:UNVERIFIED_CONTAM: hypothetical protein FKN15_063235 [Acipenser sinensis]